MVRVLATHDEEITNAYKTLSSKRAQTPVVIVETDGGYFLYRFPITRALYRTTGQVIDCVKMTVTEAADTDDPSTYDGSKPVIVPQKVVDKAQELSGGLEVIK